MKITPLEMILESGDRVMLEALLKPKVQTNAHTDYATALDNLIQHGRSNDDGYLLTAVESGMCGVMAYGTAVRAVQMTRGNRQGNNAFLQYSDNNRDPINSINWQLQ